MKCFYHTDTDAVGTCSHCGKTACRACIEDIRGVLLCKGCMALKLEARELRKEATEAHIQAARERARRKIRASKIVFIVIAAFGCVIGIAMAFASLSDPNAPPLIAFVPGVPLGAALSGYFVWALYWGIPAIWKRWWGALKGTGCFLFVNPFTLLIIIVFLFYLPLIAGYMYGIFGGGIYEYRKCKRIAEGVA